LSAALTFTMPLASMSKVTSILPRERHVNATSGAWRFYQFCIWWLCFIVLVYTINIQYILLFINLVLIIKILAIRLQ
jgi:hypothetical protein